jgi:hypothetical protein
LTLNQVSNTVELRQAPNLDSITKTSFFTVYSTTGNRPPIATDDDPRFTPAPTHFGSIARHLSTFGLSFEVGGSTVPERSDLMALEDVTRVYLEEFMFAEFSRTAMTTLDDFVTKYITANAYPMGGTAVVEFNSTARFAEGTEIFPSTLQLDEALRIAFTGENLDEYIFRLRSLPDGNVFASSPEVQFVDPPLMVTAKRARSSSAGIIIGAVGLTVLAAAAVMYKRLPHDEATDEKDLYKKSKGGGTVAGDTYAGDTFDCTASIDAASLLDYPNRHRDEEDGRTRAQLGVIREGYDASSVAPAWDGESDDEAEDGNDRLPKKRLFANRGKRHPGIAKISPALHFTAGSSLSGNVPSAKHSVLRDNDASPREKNGISRAHSIEESCDGNQSHESEDCQVTEGQFEGHSPATASTQEIESLLSYDLSEGQQTEEHQAGPFPRKLEVSESPRPRTVSEIEELLFAEMKEDGSCPSESYPIQSGSDTDDVSTPTTRPRSVSEIEALLSQEIHPGSQNFARR